MPNDITIIILAAGGSSRLGKPKQLLPYQNTTLLGHAITTALATGCKNMLVITGAAHEQITAQINEPKVIVIENTEWQSGMASSIRCGLQALENIPGINGALIMLCDQPLITAQHLNKLIEAFDNNIIATGYAGIAGVPAVFPSFVFPELLKLKGDEGAKHLVSSHNNELTIIPFENAFLDIDTAEDHEKLISILAAHNTKNSL